MTLTWMVREAADSMTVKPFATKYHAWEPRTDTNDFQRRARILQPIWRDEQGYPLSDFGAQWVIDGRADPPVDYRDLDEAALEHAGDGLLEVACEPVLPPGPR